VTGVKPFTPVRSVLPTGPAAPAKPPTFTPATPDPDDADDQPVDDASPNGRPVEPADRRSADGTADQPDEPEPRSDWQRAQAAFVDDPRAAVTAAAAMVANAVGTDTEKLRVAFRDYRTLYDKLTR
jgi:hypothetical protein